jgi:hypothetical protein
MLSFLSPLFLVGIAAAAIPIALHLFYRRAEPVVEFAAMRYLRRAPVEHAARRRLREWILLALRVSALVLLACAFARPYLSNAVAADAGEATVVMVDTSASLSAAGQFDAARELAERAIRDAPAGQSVGVIAFTQTSSVIAPISPDRAGALAAVAQLKPGAGATRYRAALQRAAESLDGRSGRIVVITDLQQSGWDPANDGGVPNTVRVEVKDVARPATNVGITDLRVESGEAIAVVRNFSPAAAGEQVVFAVGAERVGAVPVTLAAGGTAEARMRVDRYTSGALSASVADRNGYQADNVRYAVLDSAGDLGVLAVTAAGRPSDSLYLERALSVAEGAQRFQFQSVSAAGFGSLSDEALNTVDVVVLAGTRGLGERGRARLAAFVRAGGGLLIVAGPDVEGAIVAEALKGPVSTSLTDRPAAAVTFAPDDSRHPVFRVFGGTGMLGAVRFSRAARLVPADGTTVIARYSDGTPALVEETASGGGRVLVFGSDLNYRWNDFPLQTAFVPFVHETLRYLGSPPLARAQHLVGDPGVVTTAPGVIDLRGRRVAVNTDPRESDPAAMTVDAFQAGITRLNAAAARQADSQARDQEDSQGWWWYALALTVVTLAAEGLLGRRLG